MSLCQINNRQLPKGIGTLPGLTQYFLVATSLRRGWNANQDRGGTDSGESLAGCVQGTLNKLVRSRTLCPLFTYQMI